MDGCAVMFWPGLKSSTNIKTYWYDTENVIGMGHNKIVGNKVHDVTYEHPTLKEFVALVI